VVHEPTKRERFMRSRFFSSRAFFTFKWAFYPKNDRKELRRRLFLVAFIVLLPELLSFFCSFLVAFGQPLWGVSLLSNQAAAVAATFATAGTARLVLKPDLKRSRMMLEAPPVVIRLIIIALAGAAACMLLTKLIFAAVRYVFGGSAATVNFNLGLSASPSPTDLAVVIVATGLLIPLAEELLFRRWLFGRMAALGLTRVFLPISVGVFGLIHVGQSWVKVFTIMMLGGLCAWLYIRTRNVLWPWLAHAANNAGAIGLAIVGW
jgi:uncharacterized protein